MGDGELSRDGTRLAVTSDYGANTTIAFYAVKGDVKTTVPEFPDFACAFTQKDERYADPTWAPDGAGIAWESSAGITVSRFTAFGPGTCALPNDVNLTPTGSEPDWGPADPPAAAYVPAGADPAGAEPDARPTPPAKTTVKLAIVKAKGKTVTVTVPAAGKAKAVITRKGKKLATGTATAKQAGTLKITLNKAIKGKGLTLKLTFSKQTISKKLELVCAAMSHDSRVAALDSLLEDRGLDAVLATKDASIAYLTGFWGIQLERFFGVAVKRGGEGALIAPSLDRDSVGTAPTGLDQGALRRRADQRAADALRDAGRRQAHRRRGGPPDLGALAGAARGGLRARPRHRPDHGAARGQGRRRGRQGPQARARTSSRVYEELWSELKVGDSEADVNAKVAYSLARRGGAHPEPHILFGAHAGDPHGSPGARTLRSRRRRSSPTSPRSSTATGAT